MEIFILSFIIIIGLIWLGAWLYLATRRGEKCPGYPYNCVVCRHAADCIIELGRKDVKR